MQDIHNLLQEYFRVLLEFYGFNAVREFEIPSGRIDLAGFREDLSIGIEITRTSDVIKDASKLMAYPFNLRFIIVDDPLRDMFTISTRGTQINLVHYEWFENELRRAMSIPPSEKRFIPSDEWVVEISKPTVELSEFVERFKKYGYDEYTEQILDTLAYIYTAGEVPSRVSVFTKTRGVEYYKSEYLDSKITSILRGHSLIGENSKGTAESRIYYIYITNGNLAKQVLQKKIKENEDSLNNLNQKYGDNAYVIAKGTKTTEGYLKLVDRESALEPSRYSEKDLVEIAKNACPHTTVVGLNEVPINLITRYCHFLTYSSLYEAAVKFFQGLESLKLAVKIPTYDSYGQHLWDEYSTSEEVTDCILSRARQPDLDDFAVRFGVLAIIAYCSDKHVTVAREKFNELLRIFEIPSKKVEEELNKLNGLGMTSKLIQEGQTSPFIVLERDAFKEYVRRELEKLRKF